MVNSAFAQWVPVTSCTTSDLYSVWFTDPNTGYVAGENVILKTTNGGISWTEQYWGLSTFFYSLYFTGTDTGYAVGTSLSTSGQFPVILSTNDGGANWNFLNSPGGISHISVCFPEAGTGYILSEIKTGSQTVLIKTDNGGESWSAIYPDYGYYYSVFFTDANTGYIAGKQGNILKTTNGGQYWLSLHYDPSICFTSIYFPTAETGYVAGPGIIKKTLDAGLTWTTQLSDTSASLYSINSPEPERCYAAGPGVFAGEGAILGTSNGGFNWSTQFSSPDLKLFSVYFPTPDTGYAAGEHGTILKTTNGGGSSTGLSEQIQYGDRLNVQYDPLTQRLKIGNAARGSLSIFDLNGRMTLETRTTGSETQLMVGKLQAGMYIVRVRSGELLQKGKFLKY